MLHTCDCKFITGQRCHHEKIYHNFNSFILYHRSRVCRESSGSDSDAVAYAGGLTDAFGTGDATAAECAATVGAAADSAEL